MIKTIHLKVKPQSWPWLDRAAVEVNQVWNYCNEVSMKALEPGTERPHGKWLSGFDLCYLTAGMTKFLPHINADAINLVCIEYAAKRKASNKRCLRWRASSGSKRSLGWVPFKDDGLRVKGDRVRFAKKTFRVFDIERLLAYGSRKAGSFSQNSLGEWFLNVSVEIPERPSVPTGNAVGLDLGLKTAAVGSDGSRLECAPYRLLEPRISQAQKRGHKRQAKRLHTKAANQRRDALHKFSRKIVDENDLIVIGDVSSKAISKRMGKSVHDSGWYMLKTFIQYKGDYAGRKVEIVNERFTTQACSTCGCLGGPKGLRQLVVREWTCKECGALHDRDVNAARNILALSQQRPLAGNRAIPILTVEAKSTESRAVLRGLGL